MPTATLTSKGQVTIRRRSGTRWPSRPVTSSTSAGPGRQLPDRGAEDPRHRPRRPPPPEGAAAVSLREMDAAIARGRAGLLARGERARHERPRPVPDEGRRDAVPGGRQLMKQLESSGRPATSAFSFSPSFRGCSRELRVRPRDARFHLREDPPDAEFTIEDRDLVGERWRVRRGKGGLRRLPDRRQEPGCGLRGDGHLRPRPSREPRLSRPLTVPESRDHGPPPPRGLASRRARLLDQIPGASSSSSPSRSASRRSARRISSRSSRCSPAARSSDHRLVRPPPPRRTVGPADPEGGSYRSAVAAGAGTEGARDRRLRAAADRGGWSRHGPRVRPSAPPGEPPRGPFRRAAAPP